AGHWHGIPTLEEVYHGWATCQRRPVGARQTPAAAPQISTISFPRTQAAGRAPRLDRDHFRAQNRHPLGGTAPGDGLRLWNELLELPAGVARGRRLGTPPRSPPGRASGG